MTMELWTAAMAGGIVAAFALLLITGVSKRRGPRQLTTAERVEELEARMGTLETAMAALPTKEALHKVSLQVERVQGIANATNEKVERLGDKFDAQNASLERVESYLMVAATDVIMKTRPRREAARVERVAEPARPPEETK